MRPLPIAAASGGLTSLAVAVAREVFRNEALPYPAEVCLPPLTEDHYLDLRSFLVGILVGLLVGPVIDCLFILRQGWISLVRQETRGARAAFRILG